MIEDNIAETAGLAKAGAKSVVYGKGGKLLGRPVQNRGIVFATSHIMPCAIKSDGCTTMERLHHSEKK
jgi:hypothetical protein